MKYLLAFIIILFSLVSCSPQKLPFTSAVMVTSVSTDGNYAVTSNLGMQLILWNIRDRTKKIISTDANVYSAYFIKNTDNFMWQDDKTNTVYIENVNGKIVKSLNPGFPTYGQVMTSDLKYYFATNEDWSLYKWHDGKIAMIEKDDGGFLGVGKLLNLSLPNNNKYLLASGIGNCCNNPFPPGDVTRFTKKTNSKNA